MQHSRGSARSGRLARKKRRTSARPPKIVSARLLPRPSSPTVAPSPTLRRPASHLRTLVVCVNCLRSATSLLPTTKCLVNTLVVPTRWCTPRETPKCTATTLCLLTLKTTSIVSSSRHSVFSASPWTPEHCMVTNYCNIVPHCGWC